jgi:hypothetical protein
MTQAARATASGSGPPVSNRPSQASKGKLSSASAAIAAIIVTASTGNRPIAVSSESITASVPSSTAFATSVASARVGLGCSCIERSM